MQLLKWQIWVSQNKSMERLYKIVKHILNPEGACHISSYGIPVTRVKTGWESPQGKPGWNGSDMIDYETYYYGNRYDHLNNV